MSKDRDVTANEHDGVKPDAAEVETKGDAERAAAGAAPRGARLPPVDFPGFVLGLWQMALVHMGEAPEPTTGQTARDLEQARHTIDILDMLQEKTVGNLSPQEAELLQELRSELKLKYVRAAR